MKEEKIGNQICIRADTNEELEKRIEILEQAVLELQKKLKQDEYE